jgi:hypothetical protein
MPYPGTTSRTARAGARGKTTVRKASGRLAVCAALALALAGAPAAKADVGYRGHEFTASSVTDPTGQKPQSKLWLNDGIWWASLFRPGVEEFRIHRLDPGTQTWIDTGVPLDDRNSSEADILSTGSKLYVASSSDATPQLRLYRYSYSSGGGYTLDADFPVEIGSNAGPVEALVLDRDSDGRLWVTYEKDLTVYVSHTATTDADWVAPFPLPVAEATGLNDDDISALVSFDGRIGVMWSNQNDHKIHFAQHVDGQPDTSWARTTAFDQGPGSADDHINLKSLTSDPAGRVFAAIKTSFEDDPSQGTGAAQVKLLMMGLDGSWHNRTFGTVADDHTRPIVLTDRVNRRLYLLATSPTVAASGAQTIYYKQASLDDPVFAPGVGFPLMQSDAGLDINDATSTKQDLSGAPFLAAAASDDTNYWHNALPLSATPGGPPSGGGTTADRTRPVISRLSLRPSRFRPARRGRSLGGRRGSRLRFTLSERATVNFRVQRCRRRRGSRRCRYVRLRGGFSARARAGRNGFVFTGRLRGRRLRPGRYRLELTAVDAARNRSLPGRVRFRTIR